MAQVQNATLTGVGSTKWFKLNQHVTPFAASVQVGVTGTATYQVDVTLDEVDAQTAGPSYVVPTAIIAPATSASSADALVSITVPVSALRVTINSGTGTVKVRVLQAGLA